MEPSSTICHFCPLRWVSNSVAKIERTKDQRRTRKNNVIMSMLMIDIGIVSIAIMVIIVVAPCCNYMFEAEISRVLRVFFVLGQHLRRLDFNNISTKTPEWAVPTGVEAGCIWVSCSLFHTLQPFGLAPKGGMLA